MKMEKEIRAVALASLYLLIYILSFYFSGGLRIALMLFSFSPFVIGWMVMQVLKHGEPSRHTFDEAFYDDVTEA